MLQYIIIFIIIFLIYLIFRLSTKENLLLKNDNIICSEFPQIQNVYDEFYLCATREADVNSYVINHASDFLYSISNLPPNYIVYLKFTYDNDVIFSMMTDNDGVLYFNENKSPLLLGYVSLDRISVKFENPDGSLNDYYNPNRLVPNNKLSGPVAHYGFLSRGTKNFYNIDDKTWEESGLPDLLTIQIRSDRSDSNIYKILKMPDKFDFVITTTIICPNKKIVKRNINTILNGIMNINDPTYNKEDLLKEC